MLNFRKVKNISIITIFLTVICFNSYLYAEPYSENKLRTPLSFQDPINHRLQLALLQGNIITDPAEEIEKGLLDGRNAILTRSGKVLVRQELAGDPIRLLRAYKHEQIEAIMQIKADNNVGGYASIRNLILGHVDIMQRYDALYQGKQPNHQSRDFLLNDIIANVMKNYLTIEHK